MIQLGSKRGYEFSFAWIFTIIIGAAVIAFAIYFAMQIVGTKQIERESAEGKSLGVLLTPIETQTEQSKYSQIILSDETKLLLACQNPSQSNPFGSQILRVSIKPSIGRTWEDVENNEGNDLTFHNKYLFANTSQVHGEKNIYVLSKPLFLPFKTADLLLIWSDKEKFCFHDFDGVPELKEELEDLKMENIILPVNGNANCDAKTQHVVCFNPAAQSCEIKVDLNHRKVSKNGKDLYYVKSSSSDPYPLLLAAIFSDPENYNCQIQRIMAHTSKLAELYYHKSQNIQSKTTSGCSQLIQSPLLVYNTTAFQISRIQSDTSSIALIQENIQQMADSIKQTNEVMGCALF